MSGAVVGVMLVVVVAPAVVRGEVMASMAKQPCAAKIAVVNRPVMRIVKSCLVKQGRSCMV